MKPRVTEGAGSLWRKFTKSERREQQYLEHYELLHSISAAYVLNAAHLPSAQHSEGVEAYQRILIGPLQQIIGQHPATFLQAWRCTIPRLVLAGGKQTGDKSATRRPT